MLAGELWGEEEEQEKQEEVAAVRRITNAPFKAPY